MLETTTITTFFNFFCFCSDLFGRVGLVWIEPIYLKVVEIKFAIFKVMLQTFKDWGSFPKTFSLTFKAKYTKYLCKISIILKKAESYPDSMLTNY